MNETTASTSYASISDDSAPEREVISWVMEGMVDGEQVRARWDRDAHRFLANSPVMERALVIVARGDRFEGSGSSPTIRAGLDDPLAAALTAVRALDDVTTVTIDLHDW